MDAIYKIQCLEYDYVGVVIGEDLVYRNGRVCARGSAQQDSALQRYMNTRSGSQEEKRATFSRIIRDVYYVLMTRAKKGFLFMWLILR
ncbi:DNA/RNA helicase domain-containing protein [Pseudomonas sp. WPR_5_2]|uniref:DNA/RNA helicase domain-containing protein n=1 Tax=Pseudomonas sp. WPR_5_2 TaxID=1907371 RepID=UPI001314C5C0